MNPSSTYHPCHLCGELEHAHEMRVNIQNGAALWSTLSRGAIPLKRNAHKYFSLKRKAEMELNARQRQIASEALCRFVIERVKAEPVWGDEAFKRFRRALIPQLRLLNQDFESDCSESADGQAAEETSSENADIPNRMK